MEIGKAILYSLFQVNLAKDTQHSVAYRIYHVNNVTSSKDTYCI